MHTSKMTVSVLTDTNISVYSYALFFGYVSMSSGTSMSDTLTFVHYFINIPSTRTDNVDFFPT